MKAKRQSVLDPKQGEGALGASNDSSMAASTASPGRARWALLGAFGVVSAFATEGCVAKGSSSSGAESASAAPLRPPGGNLIKNADFEDGTTLPWTSSFTPPANGELEVTSGAACLTIQDGGASPWDAQIRHREMVVQEGHTYNIVMKMWADKPTMVRPKVGMAGPPYTEYWQQAVNLTTTPVEVRGGFVMRTPDDPTVEFAIHMGGNMLRNTQLPVTVCVDDVYMNDPVYVAPPKEVASARPKVRVNQLGYFPGGKKLATLVSDSTEPLQWSLRQGAKVVGSGKTEPLGTDTDSGDSLHLIDFTLVKQAGEGYVLAVGDDTSPPFSIDAEIYSELRYDALNYFYQNRSGIAIEMPYAKDEKWTRPAGHKTSDKAVPCAPDAGCSYSLDVSKGWYDAGDHGKYVVNGGIAVWTMLDQYEHAAAFGGVEAFGDGKLNIPESKNGVPDILDEARWEMEFLLAMQVPKGQPKAGMVHHKMHDVAWTALGVAPHEAEAQMKRHLRPVSTAATLNLAATAAQSARIYRPFDPKFADRCLAAAETAYDAAKKNPAIFASAADSQSGGGAYDDTKVDDEFFWAAAELFITTKNARYKADLTKSKWWNKLSDTVDGVPSVMNWQVTDGLGTISLAIVPGALSGAELKVQRDKLIEGADALLALIAAQGYRVPFSAGDSGKYPWGSNSFVINNAMVLGYAYDFTKKDDYLEGMILSMDYLLGRNANAQSYVSGYGAFPLKNPHHRFWSQQVDSRFPAAPPGALSGGPNSGLQDPYVKAAGLGGCQPQKCFVDHIEAWSVNEITINWNAPLAWVTAYLAQNGKLAKAK